MAATRQFTGVFIAGLMAWRVAAAATFHIDVGDLGARLNEWSRQAQMQILFDFTWVHGHPSEAVDCDCTAEEALRRMLGSGPFRYQFMDGRTVAVFLPTEPPADPADLLKWLGRFEYVAQAYAEGAGPRLKPLIRVLPPAAEGLVAHQR